MVDKGDAIKLETSGNQEESVPEPDVCLKWKIGEPDINPGGASILTADTPNWREPEQGSSAGNENLLAGCIAVEDELKAGRELEVRNMLNFDAFELVDELPPGKHACDMVWVDEWAR